MTAKQKVDTDLKNNTEMDAVLPDGSFKLQAGYDGKWFRRAYHLIWE